jgi:uncharacterized protein YggE
LQAGVTNINGIDFQTTELKKYRRQAREMALKAAKEKADEMAAVLGQSTGEPVAINENAISASSSRRIVLAQNSFQDMSGGISEISDTIALGKISIRANVTVVFKLKTGDLSK